jgi:hypothetical protein
MAWENTASLDNRSQEPVTAALGTGYRCKISDCSGNILRNNSTGMGICSRHIKNWNTYKVTKEIKQKKNSMAFSPQEKYTY